MSGNTTPININLLKIEPNEIPRLGRVQSPLIFDNMNNFEPTGLFSTTIFGAVGSAYRSATFGVIHLNTTVIHPLIYQTICSLKAFYKQIAEGKCLAIFNPKTGEFLKANTPDAKTGYTFFMSHVPQLKFEENESDRRNFNIKLFNKSVKEGTWRMAYLLVLPAGMRDYVVDPSGKPQEDEINTYYRKILSQANIIDPIIAKKSPTIYDNAYIGIQSQVGELYDYLQSLLEGKNKLLLGKWLSRKIFNSTRNVASNALDNAKHIDDVNRLRYNEMQVGIRQFLRCLVPKSIYEIRSKYLNDIFPENTSIVYLTNAKTLKKEEILNSHVQKEYDQWRSPEGLLSVISILGNLDMRNDPIVLNKGKSYMGLVYRDDKVFKFFQDIDDLPEQYSKDNVTPVTWAEFLYMSIYHLNGKVPAVLTRYPITGYGGIYPAMLKVVTTMESYQLEELNAEWQPTGELASSFPNKNSEYYNTSSAHVSHYAALDLDTDGDTISTTALTMEESMVEVTKLLNSREYYLSDTGKFYFSNDTDTLGAVLSYMTK